MKDIIISVDSTSHKVNFPNEFLGIGYENLQGNLIFQFDNNFIGGQARLDISIDCESGMIPNLTPYENGYILPIKSSLLTGSNVLMQLVIDETSLTQYSLTTDTEINPNKTYYEKVGNDYIIVENPVVGDISQYYEANTPVFKTDIFQLKVKDSINAQETIPEQYPTWINTLNTLIGTINQKLGLVDTALTEMNNLNINVSDKVDGEVTITFTDKQGNQKEVKINDGRGIVSILKTATSGNIDTYTITYTDNTTSTFEVTNGIDGTDGRGIVSIEKTGTTGLVDTYTITYTDNTTSIFNVANGKGITNIEKISTNLLVDTYRISFNDGTTQNYEVTNGKGIVSIEKTSTEGLTDIYTITYNDNTTTTFNVVNGKGIVSIEKTSTSGYVDTYTITYNDGTTSTYEVTNGEVSQTQLDALQDELNYYKTIVNALPKITGSGTSITLNNTADSILSNVLSPSELEQDGTPTPDSPQDIHTISGDNTLKIENKNYFNGSLFVNETITGITLSHNDKGEIVLNGTSTAQTNFNAYYFDIPESWTQLVLSGGTANVSFAINTYTSDNTYISAKRDSGSGGNYEIPSNASIYALNVRIANGITLNNYVLKAQIEKGSTATTYEPYTSQEAQINLGGSDLIKTSKTESGYINSSNEIISSTTWVHTDYINISNTNCIYTYKSYGSGNNPKTIIYNADKSVKEVVDVSSNLTKILNGAYVRISYANDTTKPQLIEDYVNGNLEYCKIGDYEDEFYKANGTNIFNVTAFENQLVAGKILDDSGVEVNDTTSTYSTYKIFLKANETIYIKGYFQRVYYYNENGVFKSRSASIGTTEMNTSYTPTTNEYIGFQIRNEVWASNKGQEMINLGNTSLTYEPYGNKWYLKKNIGKIVLDGSDDEGWVLSSTNTSGHYRFRTNVFVNVISVIDSSIADIISNYFVKISANATFTKNNGIALANDKRFYIYNDDFKEYTIEQFKTWLSTHNTIVDYPLETPTYTLLNDTLQSQLEYIYNQMLAYKGQTNISQINNDLPFVIDSTALKDLTSL